MKPIRAANVIRVLSLLVCLGACGDDDSATDAAVEDADPSDATTDIGEDGSVDVGTDAADTDAADTDAQTPTLFPPRDLVCSTDELHCETDTAARSEEDRTVVEPRELDDATFQFVLSLIRIPEATETAYGFNLDARDSGDGVATERCDSRAPDYQAVHDPLHIGVDNSTQFFVPTAESFTPTEECPSGDSDGCIDDQIADAIASAQVLIGIEVSNVDSLSHDASVMVQVFEVAFDGALLIDGDNQIEPGQMFTRGRSLSEVVEGDIFEGRLRTQFASLDITPLGNVAATMLFTAPMLERVEIRANVSESRLQSGVLGGASVLTELNERLEEEFPAEAALVLMALRDLADLAPSSDETVCEELSFGLSFSAVSAEF